MTPGYIERKDGLQKVGSLADLELPADWSLRRLRHIGDISPSNVDKKENDDETSVSLCNYTDVYYNDTISSEVGFMNSTATKSQVERFSLKSGDILLTKDSESWDDIGIPAFVPNDFPGVLCGYHLFLIRPDQEQVDPKYLNWTLASRALAFQFEQSAQGVTRYGLTTEDMSNILVPIPPLKVQQKISSFIVRQVGKIDTLIQKKEGLVEALDEKREATISQLVAEGLDPNLNLKPSNVDWADKIPAGWEIIRLKWLTTKIGSGKTPKGGEEAYVEEGVIFLRSQNVHFDGLRLDDVAYIDEETNAEMESTQVEPKDVLLNITGASLGRCSLVPGEFLQANVNQHVCILRPQPDRINPSFLNYVISSNSVQHQIFADQEGASREAVTFSQIEDFQIPVPPLDTQEAIADYLDQETARIDRLKAKLNSSIGLLKEKRESLITRAILGKIRLDNQSWSDQQEVTS
jgi:type I restriction enzyme S subunit